MSKRCFISVDIDEDDTKHELTAAQDRLAQFGSTSRTASRQFHFTLNFIGDIHRDDVNVIVEELRDVNKEPFSITLAGIGAFPSTDYIKVIWAGVKEKTDIEDLAQNVMDTLDDRFVQDREFHPHVTLLRVKNIDQEDKQKLQQAIMDGEKQDFGVVNIDRFTLKESTLTPAGAEHTIIEQFDLG